MSSDPTKCIEAIRDGLLDGGAEVFTNFPGFLSHKLFSELGGKITSTNEKTAYEIAWGASLGGKRSVVTFKNVGLDDAADPFINSQLVGVNAGLVLVIFDDVHVEGSQSRQDSRHYYDFFGGLWLEPYDLQSTYDLSYKAFEWSEKTKTPVIIRITNQLLARCEEYKRKTNKTGSKKLIIDQKRYVIHPINWIHQQNELNKKRELINTLVELINSDLNVSSNKDQVAIMLGCNDFEQNTLSDNYEKIQIVTYPLPPKLIKDKCKNKKNILCLEQGSKFGWEKLNIILSNQNIESNDGFVPNNSNGYIVYKDYEKLFSALKSTKPDIIVGDLGLYTRDSLNTIDTCLSFGSSLSVGCGLLMSGIKKVISVTGDGAYLHSGKNVIPEAILRKLNLKVVVICNGGSQVTGGQIIPGDLFYQSESVQIEKFDYKNSTEDKIVNVLRKMSQFHGVSVLYIVI